jgi:hypothetical protein
LERSPSFILVGSNIWSVRQVLLEMITHSLAFQYSKSFGLSRDQSSTDAWTRSPGRLSIDISRRKNEGNDFSCLSKSLEEKRMDQNPTSAALEDYLRETETASPISAPPVAAPSRTRPRRRKTMTISRSKYLPQMTIVADSNLRKKHVMETTLKTLRLQILISSFTELSNVVIFGCLFAYLEGWPVLGGIYFASTSLLTIGYGDFVLCKMLSRSIFIWYVFLGIASTTYLGSMIAEYASDQWIVTIEKIEKRVDRYEKKAELKRFHQSSSKLDLDKGQSSSQSTPPRRHTRSSSVIGTEADPILTRTPKMDEFQPLSLPTSHSFIRIDLPESRIRMLPDRFYKRLKRLHETSDSGSEEDPATPESRLHDAFDQETWPLMG